MSDAERVLNNLHVLSALSHNDKLMSNQDAFDIYQPTSLRGLFRTWYGEGRAQNVQRVRQTVRAGIGFASRALEDANALLATAAPDDAAMRLRIDTTALQHFRMIDALTRACEGLQNLRQTYRDDAALASQLVLLVGEAEDYVRVIRSHSEALRRQTCSWEGPPPYRPLVEG